MVRVMNSPVAVFVLALAVVIGACSSRDIQVTPSPARVTRPLRTEPLGSTTTTVATTTTNTTVIVALCGWGDDCYNEDF